MSEELKLMSYKPSAADQCLFFPTDDAIENGHKKRPRNNLFRRIAG